MGGETYYGAGLAHLDISIDGIDDEMLDATVTSLHGLVGTRFNETFSGEVRLGIGISDDNNLDDDGLDLNIKLKNYFGVYAKAGAQISEIIYPYVVAGYTRGKMEFSALGDSESGSEGDFSFGVGVDFSISETTKFNLEYMNYLDKDGVELSGFGLGFSKAL
jgi:opacity protein-like surface antigen